ncbi:MAG: phosphatidate cytidylyltransferase [Saprospiraceae bacterium]
MLKFLLLSLAFLALFALAELLYRRFKMQAEHSRKLVHIGTGLLTLLFPLMLRSHWEVLFLCAGFAGILFLSQRFGLLPSINAIKRRSHGSLCYPLAVWASFWVYEKMAQKPDLDIPAIHYFYVPVLVMALCDPAAALVGRRWPIVKFKVGAGTKSLAGMLAFFGVAMLLTASLLLAAQPVDAPLSRVLFVSAVLSLSTCLTEAFTPFGLDNITIPAVTIGTLLLLENV